MTVVVLTANMQELFLVNCSYSVSYYFNAFDNALVSVVALVFMLSTQILAPTQVVTTLILCHVCGL